ncbi:OmpA family protein [Prochlorothrix hollandica]|nr:hypothetical protein [Prochlorothrix hollandica]
MYRSIQFTPRSSESHLFMGGDRAVGQGASRSTRALGGDSLSLRASYTDNPNFQAQVQYEYRNSSGSQTSNVSASLMGKLSPSLTALFDADRRFASGSASRGLPATTQVRLGLAYRNPYSDRFNALLRYEYRQNPSTTPESLLDGSGVGTTEHLFAGEAIYSPNWQWEFYTKLGFRQSTLNLADSFTASSTVTLAQIRATYQVNRRFDLTGEARWIGQPSAGYSEMGWVGEVGFHATSNLRLALGYSSGSINNDRDFSGSRSAGGIYGGVTLKLDRLFQGFGLQQPLAQTQPRRQLTAQDPNQPTPAQLQAAAPSPPLRLQVSQAVEFTPNSAVMSPEGRVVLDSLATVMGQYGDLKLDMEAVLPPLAELTPDNLEARQLQAARQYLLSRGVAGDRITIRALNTSAAATGNTPVTFALKGPTTTFQLLSSQLGSGLVGSLLGQELPQLANLPRPSAAPGTPTAAPASTAIAAPAATPALPNLLALVNGVAIPLDQVPLDGAEPSPVRLPLLPPPADDLQAAMPRITGQFGSLAQAAVPNGITLAQGNPDRPGITPIGLSLNPDRAFWQAFVDAATPLRTAQRLDNPANGGETPDTRVSAVPNPSLSATGQGSDPGITAIARDTEQRLSVVPRAELGDAQGSTSIWSIGQLLGSSLGELAPQPTLTGLNPTALRLSLVPSLGAMPAPTLTAEPTTALDLAQAPTATPGFSPTLPSTAGRPDSIALWQTLSLWQALALNTEEATPDTFALNTENETPDTFALNTEGTPDNTLATGNTTNPDNTTALNLAVDRAFWRAMAEATTPLRTAQRPTANPNGFDISLMEARRLEAALTFLLSRDLNALDALLQASGTQAPEIRGELIDLDALMQQNQAGEGAL